MVFFRFKMKKIYTFVVRLTIFSPYFRSNWFVMGFCVCVCVCVFKKTKIFQLGLKKFRFKKFKILF